jgi:hypothetical protein
VKKEVNLEIKRKIIAENWCKVVKRPVNNEQKDNRSNVSVAPILNSEKSVFIERKLYIVNGNQY